jgi:predicted outer membrane protein
MTRIRSTSAALALAVVMAAGSLCVVAAKSQGGSSGAKPQPPKEPSAAAQPASAAASEFVNHMTIANLAEVELGKIAAQRGSNADVKAFAQMMIKDHTQANQQLAKVAAQLKVQPPKEVDQKHRDLADRLSKLQGAEFDREYMSAMVQGHEEVLSKLKARAGSLSTANEPDRQPSKAPGATSGTPPAGSKPSARGAQAVGTAGGGAGEQALNQWAAKATPVVQRHLERARSVRDKLK